MVGSSRKSVNDMLILFLIFFNCISVLNINIFRFYNSVAFYGNIFILVFIFIL